MNIRDFRKLQRKAKSGNKYNARKTVVDGIRFDSQAEANYYLFLKSEKQAGRINDFDRQQRIELRGENGSLIAHYKIDFTVYHNDGLTEFVEVKGYITSTWRMKWKLFEDKFGKDHRYKLTVVKV